MKRFNFALLLALFALGCASVTPAPPATTDGLDMAIREASDYLNANVPAGSKIVILNVQSSSDALSDYVIDELMSNAVNDRKFELVDRHQLDLIRAEQNFQMSGAVDDREALEIGKFFGAQTIVSGAVTPLGERYRMTIRALEVQSAKVQGHYNRNLEASPTLNLLIKMRGRGTPVQPSGVRLASASGGAGVAGGGAGGNVSGGGGVAGAGDGSGVAGVGAVGEGSGDVGNVGASVTSGSAAVTQANPTPTQTQTQTTYKIGGTGQAGGLIFYDKGNNSGGWRYLEAAPASTETKAKLLNVYHYHGADTFDENQTSEELGRGMENTEYLLGRIKHFGYWETAVQYCDDLEVNGFDDWYLPSIKELSYMYGNLVRKEAGGFREAFYWSSSGNDGKGGGQISYGGLVFNMQDGTTAKRAGEEVKTQLNVRACRRF